MDTWETVNQCAEKLDEVEIRVVSLLEGLIPGEPGLSDKHPQDIIEYVRIKEGAEGGEMRAEYEP